MSRIGYQPIQVPEDVEVSIEKGNHVKVKGPKGTSVQKINPDIKVIQEDGVLKVERPTEQKKHKSLHGLYRSLLNNMVYGVKNGFKAELELIGVGFKATNRGNILDLSLGYSHAVVFEVPEDIQVETETVKGQNPKIRLESHNKELLGMVASKIKSLRKVEPYKGKGIRFVGENVRTKAGKASGK